MGSSDWDAFAEALLVELRMSPLPTESDSESDMHEAVVWMNFTAGPEEQWQFICSAVDLAESDDELGHIAAGPMEHLLGAHGEASIARVEARAAADPKFARMLTGVWKHTMNDAVWARVLAIRTGVSDPLTG
jgi:hypothetical protein